MSGNYILCGFMGAGKTTIGQALAARLGLPYCDMDEEIVRAAGRSIPAIFEEEGEASFRDREHQALRHLCQQDGLIIGTGGGALTFPRNITIAREHGHVLYLNPGFEECYHRILHSDRPLVRANSKEQLAALYQQREAFYRQSAHLEITATGTADAWVDAILYRLAEAGLA